MDRREYFGRAVPSLLQIRSSPVIDSGNLHSVRRGAISCASGVVPVSADTVFWTSESSVGETGREEKRDAGDEPSETS